MKDSMTTLYGWNLTINFEGMSIIALFIYSESLKINKTLVDFKNVY